MQPELGKGVILDYRDENPFYDFMASEPAGELEFGVQGTITVHAEQLRDAVRQAYEAGKSISVRGQMLVPGHMVEFQYYARPTPVKISLWWRFKVWLHDLFHREESDDA